MPFSLPVTRKPSPAPASGAPIQVYPPTHLLDCCFPPWHPQAISRSRFWGTPSPIWVSDDFEEVVVIGSIAELEEATGAKVGCSRGWKMRCLLHSGIWQPGVGQTHCQVHHTAARILHACHALHACTRAHANRRMHTQTRIARVPYQFPAGGSEP